MAEFNSSISFISSSVMELAVASDPVIGLASLEVSSGLESISIASSALLLTELPAVAPVALPAVVGASVVSEAVTTGAAAAAVGAVGSAVAETGSAAVDETGATSLTTFFE